MNSKQKIVLFDIDYTLFDTTYFDKVFHRELSGLLKLNEDYIRKFSREIITDLVTEDSYLDIDKYIDNLLNVLDKKEYKKSVEELLFKSSFFKNGFYKEVEDVLKEVKKIAKIGIFSTGDKKLQWAKIEQSGFKDFFHNDFIYIGTPTKSRLIPVLKEKHAQDIIYLIDDKPSVITEVKEFMPSVFGIWIKRGKYVDEGKNSKDFKPDAIVTDLLEAVEIIRKN